MSWRTVRDEQLGRRRQHVPVLELAGNDQRQEFTAGFADYGQDAELTTMMGADFGVIARSFRLL